MAKLFKIKKLSNWKKVYKAERRGKKPVSWHHDRDPFKDINYIFSLRAAFMECISFI